MEDTLRGFSDQVVIFDEKFAGKGGWKNTFPGKGPLVVELGTGKGQFLREMAQRYPETCFVGLEREPGILLQAVRQAQDLEVDNLKFILGDVQFLNQLFAPAEIDCLYIHFCDPWPKSRHDKRRLNMRIFCSCTGRYWRRPGVFGLKQTTGRCLIIPWSRFRHSAWSC